LFSFLGAGSLQKGDGVFRSMCMESGDFADLAAAAARKAGVSEIPGEKEV
jgi:hypothetical protein